MSKSRVVSINLTQIRKFLEREGSHSAFSRAENGDLYVSLFITDKTMDQYKNDVGVKLNPKKEKKDTEGNDWIKGNGRQLTGGGNENASAQQGQTPQPPPVSDLPF